MDESVKKPRGFAAMDREKQREIARRGGKAAHERGTAHEFSRDEARDAGRKGGYAVAKDRDYMSRIGREGARKSAEVRSKKAQEAREPKPAGDGAKDTKAA